MTTKKSNKKASVKSSNPKDELLFELEGTVYIIEKKDGKITSKTPLDGNIVLGCLVRCLERSLDFSDKDALTTNKGK